MGNAFASGALMNFGDEATAAVRAAAPGFANWMMQPSATEAAFGGDNQPKPQTTSKAGTFDERYSDELAKERDKAKAFAEAHPNLSTGANIAGNVAGTVAALPAAFTRAAPTLLGNALKIGATGAGLGAVSGFGEGEGESDRIGKGLVGGVLGGGTGAVLPFVGAAGKAILESAPGRYVSEKVVSPAIRSLAEALGQRVPTKSLSAAAPDDGAVGGALARAAESTGNVAQAGAVDRLALAMQRAKVTAGDANRKLTELGPAGMLADLDPQLLAMASGAHTLPGETRTMAPIVLGSRDRQTGNRIASAFEGNEPPPSSYDLGRAFEANRSAVGKDAYGAMRDAGLNSSPQMDELGKIPAVKNALAQIQEDAASTGTTLSPVEVMHRVKQKLNDTAEAAFASGKPINKADMRGLANDWEAAFWQANPQAKAADASYAKAASLPEYFAAGRSLLRRGSTDAATDASAPALTDLLGSANQQQALAARAGATNAARETALEGTRPARALAQRIDQSAPVQEKIGALYPGPQAQSILRRAQAEGTFANTSNKILAGSQTAEKATDAATLGNSGLRITNQGIGARAMEHFTDTLTKLEGPNEAVRNEIGRMMLNSDSSESRRFLKLAQALLDQRRGGSPIRAGLIEGAANAGNQ